MDLLNQRKDTTLIIIDQLRGDYSQYLPKVSNILPFSAICDTNSIPTSTEAMHANISTGVYPKDHGLISKNSRHGKEKGLEEILDKFKSGKLQSLSMLANRHSYSAYLVGGKPETVAVMGPNRFANSSIFFTNGTFRNLKDLELVQKYGERKIKASDVDFHIIKIFKILKKRQAGKNLNVLMLPGNDLKGHEFGPHHRLVVDHLRRLDSDLYELLCLDPGNIIVVGDHGSRNTSRYMLEIDEEDSNRIKTYVKKGDSLEFKEEYRLTNPDKVEYDGGLLRMWSSGLSDCDATFLSRYCLIVSRENIDRFDEELIQIYRNSEHENLGDFVALANEDVTFCKHSWIPKNKLARIRADDRLDYGDLPIGEHGSTYCSDRHVCLLTNVDVGKRINNVEIKNIILSLMVKTV